MSVFARARCTADDDSEQFSRLYEETCRDLFAFLLRRCRTADAAADCLAESYRIAWEKRDHVPDGADARPWLFGVARNVMRREIAHDYRAAAASRELAAAAERVSATVTPQNSAVADALAELSEVDQEIVTMLSFDGLAPREVASILGLSPNVVRVRAHRAREKLRTTLRRPTDPDAGRRVR
jgi:RNA polymerase sigma-70 factor (ECF subfamily)